MKENKPIILNPLIENKICFLRGQKVMLDYDLAVLYQVETKALNRAVKRNNERFPVDFLFKLTIKEEKNLISQIAISNSSNLKCQFGTSSYSKRGGRRKPISAFTEQGVAMLSSVLRSKRAIAVNIQIMRTFTKLREMLSSNKELKEKLEELEKKYDGQFKLVFEAIRQLITEEKKPKERMGFRVR